MLERNFRELRLYEVGYATARLVRITGEGCSYPEVLCAKKEGITDRGSLIYESG
jgi:hypothetical protein